MRLLNTTTFELESFVGHKSPPYAILSHTWREEEILYEDVQGGKSAVMNSTKKGRAKFLANCDRAERDLYKYIWIDRCCIDKSSSAELSEAINSKFRWYQNAGVCYAYLDDYPPDRAPIVGARPIDWSENTYPCRCHWFSRGWTLQELRPRPNRLAPG